MDVDQTGAPDGEAPSQPVSSTQGPNSRGDYRENVHDHDQADSEGRASLEAEATRTDLRAVAERLIIAGLQQHELADQLGHQLAFTAAITGSLGEGVYATDLSGRITFVNPAVERLLGWTEAKLLGGDAHELLHARCDRGNPSASQAGCPLFDVARTSVIHRDDDVLFLCQKGVLLPVSTCSAPIVVAGQVTGTVVTFDDMTERHHAEQVRASLITKLERALAFRNQFLSMTTHELRTPLAGIKGYAQLLSRPRYREDEQKVIQAVRLVVQASDRMNGLIQDLADAARIEREGSVLAAAPFDLNAALLESVEEVGVAVADVALYVDEQTRGLWVRGDRERIRQVLLNLLSNAVKYSGTSKIVDVAIHRADDSAVVTVTDYGIGIPAREQAAVFELNFRGSNVSANRDGGYGLGLFISKRIVDQHGGSLAVASVEGEGSTFTLSLPLAEGAHTS